MIVRKFNKDENQRFIIPAIAFHLSKAEIEKRKREDFGEDWGAFLDDGTAIARIKNQRTLTNFDGNAILNGCIGGVATLPEHRASGAVRKLLEAILCSARQEGEIISTLGPFNHDFYRKFGYEITPYGIKYEFLVTALEGFKHKGWAKMWKQGDCVNEYLDIYNNFTKRYNLAFIRDERQMATHVKGDCLTDRRFCYLIGNGDKAEAYVVFDDVSKNMVIDDFAFNGKDGLNSLLGFLARFSADYGNIIIKVPFNLDLSKIIRNPYYLKPGGCYGYMTRVINAPKLLSLMNKNDADDFVIDIQDNFFEENNGVFLVSGDKVKRSSLSPDLKVSVLALSQLALGSSSLEEALLRDDVEVIKNIENLKRVFVKKECFVADHF